MGHQSIVSGYILEKSANREQNRTAIAHFTFDEKYPFSNIFWNDSPANFDTYIIGFTGSYRQIEDDWNEWLWKFSQFLSTLEALNAVVNLDCHLGCFRWKLQPFSRHQWMSRPPQIQRLPETFRGEPWGIYEAPDNDFTLMHPWNSFEWNDNPNKIVPRWTR